MWLPAATSIYGKKSLNLFELFIKPKLCLLYTFGRKNSRKKRDITPGASQIEGEWGYNKVEKQFFDGHFLIQLS
jgi:hypothetical protein